MDILIASAAFLVFFFFIHRIHRRRTSNSLPIPGPPPHPFVGHTFQVPTIKTWKYFEQLSHQYGPIVKVTLAGDDFVVLSDPADAEELLGRRARIYSSRRPLIYAGKYRSNDMRMSLMPYGDNLKKQRAAFHQMLQPRAIGGYESSQHRESLNLLLDLVKTPGEYFLHFQRFSASLVFTLSFGQFIDDDGRALGEIIALMATFVQDTNPSAYLVDTFPILDWLPDCLAAWRVEARHKHQLELDLYGRLALGVKARMEKDIGMECFTARLWEQQTKLNLTDEELFYVAGTAFIAGTDTSSISLLWFVMAMALYPATMRKAQDEIDQVFDPDTLPNFTKMQDLPYCAALIKEVIRWSPVVPLSVPHYTDADDQYKGYTIRKGTSVISSLWNMHHDETKFPNSYIFDPERHLSKDSSTSDATESLGEGHYGFGFGRRKCPGQHMGAKSTWIAVVRVLWAFNIEPRKDEEGNPMKIDPEDCTSGITVRPNKFPVNFVPRSGAHTETIVSSGGHT
ncbi:cytochrome P450 [Mycena olivaceomarginata]|nr:cytochrome P450 [Mycena olivaceomarginata]